MRAVNRRMEYFYSVIKPTSDKHAYKNRWSGKTYEDSKIEFLNLMLNDKVIHKRYLRARLTINDILIKYVSGDDAWMIESICGTLSTEMTHCYKQSWDEAGPKPIWLKSSDSKNNDSSKDDTQSKT